MKLNKTEILAELLYEFEGRLKDGIGCDPDDLERFITLIKQGVRV